MDDDCPCKVKISSWCWGDDPHAPTAKVPPAVASCRRGFELTCEDSREVYSNTECLGVWHFDIPPYPFVGPSIPGYEYLVKLYKEFHHPFGWAWYLCLLWDDHGRMDVIYARPEELDGAGWWRKPAILSKVLGHKDVIDVINRLKSSQDIASLNERHNTVGCFKGRRDISFYRQYGHNISDVLDWKLDDLYHEMSVDMYMGACVKRIQRAWRLCIADPRYRVCRNRLMRELAEISS